MNRLAPPVGAPYGMPLKTLIPASTAPRTLPEFVSTGAVNAAFAVGISIGMRSLLGWPLQCDPAGAIAPASLASTGLALVSIIMRGVLAIIGNLTHWLH